MFVNFAILQIPEAMRAEFEAQDYRNKSPIRSAPGFVSLLLLRDDTKPGRYFYSSTWRSHEDIVAYRESEAVVKLKKAMASAGDVSRDQVDCTIIAEEYAVEASEGHA